MKNIEFIARTLVVRVKLLKKGSKGEFVQLMREMLKKLGYEVSTDGIFGSGTEKIVIQFQKDNNLKQLSNHLILLEIVGKFRRFQLHNLSNYLIFMYNFQLM